MLRFPADSVWDAVQSSASAPAPFLTHTELYPPTHFLLHAQTHTCTVTPAYASSLVDTETQNTHTDTHLLSLLTVVAVHKASISLDTSEVFGPALTLFL